MKQATAQKKCMANLAQQASHSKSYDLAKTMTALLA